MVTLEQKPKKGAQVTRQSIKGFTIHSFKLPCLTTKKLTNENENNHSDIDGGTIYK